MMVTIGSGSTSASWSSPTRRSASHPAARPATRTSPPRLTSTPQPAAVGGPASRCGRRPAPSPWRRGRAPRRSAEHPLSAVPPTSPPPGSRTGGAGRVGASRSMRRSRGRSPGRGRPRRPSGRRGRRSARRPQRDGDRLGEQRHRTRPRARRARGRSPSRGEPAARRVDRRQLVGQDVLGGDEPVRVGREERDRGPPYGPLDPPRRAGGHDAPEVVRPGWVARRGGWTGGCRAFGDGDDTGCA